MSYTPNQIEFLKHLAASHPGKTTFTRKELLSVKDSLGYSVIPEPCISSPSWGLIWLVCPCPTTPVVRPVRSHGSLRAVRAPPPNTRQLAAGFRISNHIPNLSQWVVTVN